VDLALLAFEAIFLVFGSVGLDVDFFLDFFSAGAALRLTSISLSSGIAS
jgi:hypothetical protein